MAREGPVGWGGKVGEHGGNILIEAWTPLKGRHLQIGEKVWMRWSRELTRPWRRTWEAWVGGMVGSCAERPVSGCR